MSGKLFTRLPQSECSSLKKHFKDHELFAKSERYSNNTNYNNYNNFNYNARFNRGFRDEGEFIPDWRLAIVNPLENYRHFESIVSHYAGYEAHMLPDEWLKLGEAHAAIGNSEEAKRCRKRAADMKLVELLATDKPELGDQNSYYSWRWYWYGSNSGQRINNIRNALASGASESPWQKQDGRAKFKGAPSELWEIALVDKQVEAQFLKLADVVQPHWGASNSLSQLISYYRAKRNYVAILELLDHVFDLKDLLQSRHLSNYVHACFKERDSERIDELLDVIESESSALKDDVLLARLVLLRFQGKDVDAQKLELQLIEQCRTSSPNPNRLDTTLLKLLERNNRRWYSQDWNITWRSQPFARTPALWYNDLPTVSLLATSLGIRFDAQLTNHDLTLSRMRNFYQRNGLNTHAIRILELQLDDSSGLLTTRGRAHLLIEKAALLSKIGNIEGSYIALSDAEKLLRSELEKMPGDTALLKQLVRIYKSPNLNPDNQQWYRNQY